MWWNFIFLVVASSRGATADVADRFLASAKELLGTPFEVAPTRIPGQPHPTESKSATNCAGVIEYALRKNGYSISYLGAKGLKEELRRRKWQLKSGAPIRPGDILHFGAQSAILAEDHPPLGKLSDEDVILHAYWDGPVRLERWKDIPYRDQIFEIFRVQ